MRVNYNVTKSSLKNIEKYDWLKANFKIGKIGDTDDRDIVRLLENTNYPNIAQCLHIIDKYGERSDEIGENILNCNDPISFGRYLSELFLFVFLVEKLNDNVKSIRRIKGKRTPDISIKANDWEFLIEIYTPMDFYGYQTFSKLIKQTLKNLDIDIGFDIITKLESDNFSFAFDLPNLDKEIYNWLENYKIEIIQFLQYANEGDYYDVELFSKAIIFTTTLNKVYKDKKVRSIVSNESTRSNDTKLFFEIQDPEEFSKTQWGLKIKSKLQRKQAGNKRDGVIRILVINFSFSDTSDISFFNYKKYYDNLVNDIKFLVSDSNPYPPYDLVVPCELGFECGFVKPINLSDYENSKIEELFSIVHLDKPIVKLPQASKNEVDNIFEYMSIDKNNYEFYNKEFLMEENRKGLGVILAVIAIIIAIVFIKSGSFLFYLIGGAGALYLFNTFKKK
ncbi:hypothetical protein D4R71_02665 [bacterium]|nr:MAG: hypothetical protein D4R71_02665 [bacterium]